MLTLRRSNRPPAPPTIDRFKAFVAEVAAIDCGHELHPDLDGSYCVFCNARAVIAGETRQETKQAVGRIAARRAARNVELTAQNNELRIEFANMQQQQAELRHQIYVMEMQQTEANRHPIENVLHASPFDEVPTAAIAEALSKSTSWVTTQARRLKEDGLITIRKDGNSNVYGINTAAFANVDGMHAEQITEAAIERPPSIFDDEPGEVRT